MGVSLAQSAVALIVILFIMYFIFCKYTEEFVSNSTDFQTLVDSEFANYYRPVESGYLYLLKIISQDPEFMEVAKPYLPQCPQQQLGNETVITTTTINYERSSRPGGWFYESGDAYNPKPTQENEITINPCQQNPDLEMSIAERLWAIRTKMITKNSMLGSMIPFFVNSKVYGGTNSFRSLPQGGVFDYIYTLTQMILSGRIYINKLSNYKQIVNVNDVNTTISKYKNLSEGFASNCCNEPDDDDIAKFNARAEEFNKYANYIADLLKEWSKVEKALRAITDKFEKQVSKGFTPENVKDFGLESIIQLDDD